MASGALDEGAFRRLVLGGDVPSLQGLLQRWNDLPADEKDPKVLNLAVIAAIKSQRPDILDVLLQSGASIPKAAPSSALSCADPIAVLRILLRHGWDVNKQNAWGQPFWHTALIEDRSVLEFLIENGASIDAMNPRFGTTALDEAAQAGNVETFKFLLSQGASFSSSNALHAAAGSELEEGEEDEEFNDRILSMMQYLLDEIKLDVNAVSRFKARPTRYATENGPPLCAAIRSGQESRIKLLLDHGADQSVKTQLGDTVMQYARRWELEDGLKVLEQWNASQR